MSKFHSIIDCFSQWFKQYQQAQESFAHKDFFRLVDIKNKKSGYQLEIQVVGKSVSFTATPEEILSNHELIEYFSSKDIRTITYYSCAKYFPQNEVLSQKVNHDNQLSFKLKNYNDQSVIEKTAGEISLDEDFIKTLSPKDAHLIGYAAAKELENRARH